MDGRDINEICENIQMYQEMGITHLRCQCGGYGALLDVFPGMPEYRKGYVYANDKPGLGVDIDEAEAAKYPCENTVTTWTQTRGRGGALVTP